MAIVLSGSTNDITVNGVSVATDAEVSYAVERAVPAGTIINFAAATAPAGYLKANGALLSRTTYATLFAEIGTTFGIGDGSTTFALPDLRGYFPRGWDDGRGIDTSRVFGSNQNDEFKSHTHNNNGIIYMQGSGIAPSSNVFYRAGSTTSTETGGAETRPKNIALLYCIKY